MRTKSLEEFFKEHKKITIPTVIILMAVGIYALLHFFVFEKDPIQILVWDLFETYQYFIEGIADFYLWFLNTGISIVDHVVYFDGQAYEAIENGMLLKKWTGILVIIIWLTPSPLRLRAKYTILLIGAILIFIPIGVALNANFNLYESEFIAAYRIGRGFPLLAFTTLLLFWLKAHSIYFLNLLGKLPFLLEIYKAKKTSIIIIIYFALILKSFITGAFAFEGWVNLIFYISQFFLNLLGHDAQVSPFFLYNEDIVIFMNKSCLGFMTMFAFASIVWLTGKNNKTTWLYMFLGIIILNLANIIRFILLYIYLTKHGSYLLSIDIHDIYTAGIYIIVLLLWLLWFEKFSNLNTSQKKT